ncbi:hypothetical protein AAG906_008061 [Vitis piasezkii]
MDPCRGEYVDEMLAMGLSHRGDSPRSSLHHLISSWCPSSRSPRRSRLPYSAGRDTEIVDFGMADQPRELRIGSDLSTDERDSLIHRSILLGRVSHGLMRTCQGLDPSIVRHRLPPPHAGPVKILIGGRVPEWLANVVPAPKRTASQILMAPEDMEKTSFITEWGTYCYRVMPFGLKNAGATYQRATTTLFHDMMHRDVEVYVDDMIVKSRDRPDHLAALERFFERIRQFRLRLNPKKCTFGVTSGKLLGYMVSERGIEVDPDKIRAILDMPAPRTEREVRGFLGRLHVSAHSRGSESTCCHPQSWRLLHQAVLYSYTYLSQMWRWGACWLTDDSGKDRAIYYPNICLMQTALVGRLMRWLVLLTEFDIHYVTQKSIRGSIVADHLASLPVSDARAIDDDFPDEDVAAVTRVGACT